MVGALVYHLQNVHIMCTVVFFIYLSLNLRAVQWTQMTILNIMALIGVMITIIPVAVRITNGLT